MKNMTINTVFAALDSLLDYAKTCELLYPLDETFARNSLLAELKLESYEKQKEHYEFPECLNILCDYAAEQGRINNTIAERDLFDTRLMGCVTPRPSEVVRKFWSLYAESPKAATDYFYKLSQDCNYIRRDRIAKDEHWTTQTKYGELEISINLSKPEKDPRDIAAAKLKKASGYPKCLLCVENVGYAGTISHPARQNLRVMPVTVNGQPWGFQYSPYVYYNEHAIVMNTEHTPMVIDRSAFDKLFSFVEQFPHYFLGSNADLPIVGGSILAHEHFQGGHHTFPMEKAEKDLLSEPPRDPKQGILTKELMTALFVQGGLIAVCTMIAFYIGLSTDSATASSMAFATLTLARLFHGFNCRSRYSIFKIGLASNIYSVGAFFGGVLLLALVIFVPVMRTLFSVSPLSGYQIGMIALLAFIPTVIIQLYKVMKEHVHA